MSERGLAYQGRMQRGPTECYCCKQTDPWRLFCNSSSSRLPFAYSSMYRLLQYHSSWVGVCQDAIIDTQREQRDPCELLCEVRRLIVSSWSNDRSTTHSRRQQDSSHTHRTQLHCPKRARDRGGTNELTARRNTAVRTGMCMHQISK